ncbi:hypothetical protein ACFLZ3_05930 [Candidatus Omnitrophota bacterium]
MDGKKGKIILVLFLILVILSLTLAGAGFYLLQNEKQLNLSLQSQLKDVREKYKAAEAKFIESRKIISQMDEKLAESASRIERLNREVQQEKGARLDDQSALRQAQLELDKQRGLRNDLEGQLRKSREELKGLKLQLAGLEKAEDKESKIMVASGDIELGEIIVKPESAKNKEVRKSSGSSTKAEPGISVPVGNVMVVSKEYDFAVIDLGSKDGVKPGDRFAVFRNDKFQGNLIVEKIHDLMSAVTFESARIKKVIREGDKVFRCE